MSDDEIPFSQLTLTTQVSSQSHFIALLKQKREVDIYQRLLDFIIFKGWVLTKCIFVSPLS